MVSIKQLIILLIRAYQVIPFASHNACRFTPTCSNYMIDAIKIYGVKKGIELGLKRISRCHPGGDYGYDPVPTERKNI